MDSALSITAATLAAALATLGLPPGAAVLAHSSLRSFGHVEGGADGVIDGLLAAAGPAGTVMAPTLTGSEALSPANPPRFDPAATPCWTGRIPETLSRRPGAVRSLHPTHSVAAVGADAAALTAGHARSVTPCDELSPYGALARRADGYVLLLGVDHESSTLFHHVEELAGLPYHMQPGFALATQVVGGVAQERPVMLHRYGAARCFNRMEPLFSALGIQRTGQIGAATVRLVHAAGMVAAVLAAVRADPSILLADPISPDQERCA